MTSLDPLVGVTITAREIYDGIVRLTGRVDVLIEQQSATQADVADHEGRLRTLEQRRSPSVQDHQDHEGRLRTLERARWPLPSVAVLVSIAAIVVSFLLR